MKKTPLYEKHIEQNAKLVNFSNFQMPIQYTSIVEEHRAVRNSAGIFDVSHMGEFIISGSGAEKFLNRVTINDVSSLNTWGAQYSAMCLENGGIIDDLLIYRYPDHYMLVVNCGNIEKDLDWLMANKPENVDILNLSDEIGLVALQEPKSRDILENIVDFDIYKMNFYQFCVGKVDGQSATIARTGYTGELGYEIYADNKSIKLIWDSLVSAGRNDLYFAGLGCRDTLRIEMKYLLYGNDMDELINPIEAGLKWITKLKKNNFIGKSSIIDAEKSVSRKLVCIEMLDRGIPRKDYEVFYQETLVGIITSGTQSPSLSCGIGLAYVNIKYSKVGTKLDLRVRNKFLKCHIVKAPFYKEGTSNK